MTGDGPGFPGLTARAAGWLDEARRGPLKAFLRDGALEIGGQQPHVAQASQSTVLAVLQLQAEPDYRSTLRAWFSLVETGGHLVLVVPHAFLFERQLALPSRWNPKHRRLYTPGSLLNEIEESFEPNTYRIRYLGDADSGYDYTLGIEEVPTGSSEIVTVIEKITPPVWTPALTPDPAPFPAPDNAPDYGFEPSRTRLEIETLPLQRKILILKLDHLGDFIMAVEALQRARAAFADAEITLVVGSWNFEMAQALGIADKVVAFDVFPRNSSEEDVDVEGKSALYRATITEAYDLAIDLRIEADTRFLLHLTKARLRAGVGTRAQFRYLDIFLPIDATRHDYETAREFLFDHHAFASQSTTVRNDYRLISSARGAERRNAIVWGPYQTLRSGRYLFEPHIEIPGKQRGRLRLDIALDTECVAEDIVTEQRKVGLPFTVEKASAKFEFRIWTIGREAALDFSFFGGRLVREGASSVLHQSEYMQLLIELVTIRVSQSGVLAELATT